MFKKKKKNCKKIGLLQKLDCGVPVRRFAEDYGVRITTVCNLKEQKVVEILQ